MRSDAANLLNRLGQKTLKYKEFGDGFADIEPWPLLETLIWDSRLSGEPAGVDVKPILDDPAPMRPVEAKFPRPVVVQSSPEQPAGLFHRYQSSGSARRANDRDKPKGQNVRSILKQLGDSVATGRLQCR